MNFTRLEFRRGKSKTAKVYPGDAPARTLVALNRYNAGCTVGHGRYYKFSHVDPIGSWCHVLGWFEDGRVAVALPAGGCATLGRADIEIRSWPEFVTPAMRAAWAALPSVSLVENGEIKKEERAVMA